MDYLHIAKIDTFNDRTHETVYLRSEHLSSMSYLDPKSIKKTFAYLCVDSC